MELRTAIDIRVNTKPFMGTQDCAKNAKDQYL